MTLRLAINGFGRTGRAALRAALVSAEDLEVVAVNDLGAPEELVRLLRRDSVHGALGFDVELEGTIANVAGQKIEFLHEAEIAALPWGGLDVDVVIESTGHFTRRDEAALHLAAGARRVVISAPGKDVDATFVIGANEETFDATRHFVVSNASCTTNCLALLAKVLDDAFGIEQGLMSTVHAYTGDQRLVDALHKDPRRARAAALNIVPTTTGAARSTGAVLRALEGHLDGLSLRVPVADGSITDLVALVREPVSVERVHEAYATAASQGRLVGLLEYSEEPLVSSDVVGATASCVFDAPLTMVAGQLVKVLGWYDNETAYSTRLVDLAVIIGAA